MASSSLVFRRSDPADSSALLKTAKQVFRFANSYWGSYGDSLLAAVCLTIVPLPCLSGHRSIHALLIYRCGDVEMWCVRRNGDVAC
ncbi:unnamed protein product [Cuscuta epithymum]|uniref:Uncharacterized protein n=1 Tax=Cuscuta epithymum TaxID=186058 RepID=A0AAV0FFQ3_9ASTE|nr:unnamed protein product [Cuscuta epithymum]